MSTNYKAINIHLLNINSLNKNDQHLTSFLNDWNNLSKKITVETSGSTGNPKTIYIEKKAISNSAVATNSYFNLNESSVFLQCLPTKYIAGKMMLIRSIEANGKIVFSDSYSNPLLNLNQPIDFCAMTPFQVSNAIKHSKENFKWINTLIIGGGIINSELEQVLKTIPTKCYHTFGMTETISHIALRKINSKGKSDIYSCLEHVTIDVNTKNQLIINSKKLNVQNLITNDIIEIIDAKRFKWKGRLDNVINSGGVKHYPEFLEQKLEETLKGYNYIIDKTKHPELGEQIILIIETKKNVKFRKSIFINFDSFEIPKKIFELTKFIYANNNKINRLKTSAKAINLNKWYKPCQ
jgi:O-succinylbenzoic acid--CoA ligase